MACRWYVVQVKPDLQATAATNLARQDFPSFFPKVVWRKSKSETCTEPLFKGYGFVSFDVEEDRWRAVNGTRGVIKLLPKHSEIPIPVRIGFVEALLERDPIEMDWFKQMVADIVVGRTVDVTHGLAEGRRGVIDKIKGRFVEIVSPSKEGNSNPITIPTNALMMVLDRQEVESETPLAAEVRRILDEEGVS